MRTCTKCGVAKPLDQYHRDGKAAGGRSRRCKACKAERNADDARRFRAKNPNYAVAYRAENRDKFRTYAADSRETKPHYQWERRYRRRAAQYGYSASVRSFTRAELIARYGDACVHCGGPFEQLDHHPVPVALGGAHSLENCVPACAACNWAQGSPVRIARSRIAATKETSHV